MGGRESVVTRCRPFFASADASVFSGYQCHRVAVMSQSVDTTGSLGASHDGPEQVVVLQGESGATLFYHDCLFGGLYIGGGIDQLSSLGAVFQGSTGATCTVSFIVAFKV